MSTKLWTNVFFLTHLTTSTILTQQSWHETPLLTVNFQSSLDGLQQYAIPAFHITNDNKNTDQRVPWTHQPTCTDMVQSIGEPLCIYTSTTFASGRGISFFTTPSLAEKFASFAAFSHLNALKKDGVNEPTGAYTTKEIEGKGIGVLASRPLAFGDLVTAHTPAFIAYLESSLSTLEREKWWRSAIEQLPPNLKAKFLALSTVYGDERVRVQDIVKANTFQLEIGGVNHLAIWPETSRLNHDCAPNAQYIIDTETLTHYVHITRPIAEGEEITIAYTSPLDPTATRQQHLQQGFHFQCACARCLNPTTTDTTLTHISTLQAKLNDWSPSPSSATPQLAESLITMYEEEGLQGFMDIPYGFACLAYSAVGDKEGAVRYAEMARRAVLMKDGIWSGNLGIWESMLKGGVEGHWSWRRRV